MALARRVETMEMKTTWRLMRIIDGGRLDIDAGNSSNSAISNSSNEISNSNSSNNSTFRLRNRTL